MSNGYQRRGFSRAVRGRSRSGCTTRIILALVVLGFAYFKWMASTDVVVNAYTGEKQRIALTPKQEIQMGLQSREPMARQHGGLHPDSQAQAMVDRVGAKLISNTRQLARHGTPPDYPYEFHLLADERSINAFALPGGQIFITAALFKQLENEDQLAGVLGHEVGHVIAKHSNEQMSKSGLLKGIGGAAGVLVGGDMMGANAGVGRMVNHVLSTRYGRDDEYESDEIGAILMAAAGYNPEQLIGVMQILKNSSKGRSGPEMMSSHPYPEKRAERLKTQVIPAIRQALSQ